MFPALIILYWPSNGHFVSYRCRVASKTFNVGLDGNCFANDVPQRIRDGGGAAVIDPDLEGIGIIAVIHACMLGSHCGGGEAGQSDQ